MTLKHGRSPNAADIISLLGPIVTGGADSCLKGTPMIPLHRNTVAAILMHLEGRMEATGDHVPSAICGYPIPGWMLDSVTFDERQGQPDGWIVSLKRECDSCMLNKHSTAVMARSDIGPLEAWDEALQIAIREDAREAERAQRIEARRAETQGDSVADESATLEEGDAHA